jgi:pyruvate kinase
VTAYFSDGKEHATVLKVNENKLIMQQGPKRVIGPGESVNIPDASLQVQDYFTQTDIKYIEACKKIEFHNYMLSFVEKQEDVDALYQLDEKAEIIAKIESKKGLDFVGDSDVRLMAARGDLYVELKMPHHVINALEKIIAKNKNAVAASRIFSSLADNYEPSCADIGDADNLLRMGYRTFMLGDEICMQRDSIISALNLFGAISAKYS